MASSSSSAGSSSDEEGQSRIIPAAPITDGKTVPPAGATSDADVEKVKRAWFEHKFCDVTKITPEFYAKHYKTVECKCGMPECRGFSAVSRAVSELWATGVEGLKAKVEHESKTTRELINEILRFIGEVDKKHTKTIEHLNGRIESLSALCMKRCVIDDCVETDRAEGFLQELPLAEGVQTETTPCTKVD